jgi:hypothetical protein
LDLVLDLLGSYLHPPTPSRRRKKTTAREPAPANGASAHGGPRGPNANRVKP